MKHVAAKQQSMSEVNSLINQMTQEYEKNCSNDLKENKFKQKHQTSA